MPIPKWRKIQYEDDGVTAYQCLRCGNKWQARTDPSGWKYCPYCACQWNGQHECMSHWERHYYPDYKFQTPRETHEQYHWEIQFQSVWHDEPIKESDWQYYMGCYGNGPEREKFSTHEQYIRALMVGRLRHALKSEDSTSMFPGECKKYFRLVLIREYYPADNFRKVTRAVKVIGPKTRECIV